MKKKIVCFIFLMLLVNCSNAYRKFYNGGEYPENKNQCTIAGSFFAGQSDGAIQSMSANGFVYIGQSVFSSGNSYSQQAALNACNEIGADAVVVMQPVYQGSQTYAYNTTQYHPGQPYYTTTTTNYSGNAYYSGSAYGYGGSVNWNGNVYGNGTLRSTTTGWTPGYTTTQTNYMTVNRFLYGALFFKSVEIAKNDDEVTTFAECMERADYIWLQDICSINEAIGVYWNADENTCEPFDPNSDFVLAYCASIE